jgi:hypothetical protein
LQAAILRLLASQRNPESFVAGADLLAAHGFDIGWIRREPGIHAAIVRQGGERTRLEWVRDADFRFSRPSLTRCSVIGCTSPILPLTRRSPRRDGGSLASYAEHDG